MARKKTFNPFYLLLVVVGTAFVITASAYGVMATRALRPPRVAAGAEPPKSSLLTFMEEHGEKLLVGELLVLAIATVGAISTDGYWAKRAAASPPPDSTDDDKVNQG
jgi:hypothetical protein